MGQGEERWREEPVLVPPPRRLTRLGGTHRLRPELRRLVEGHTLGAPLGGAIRSFLEPGLKGGEQGYRLTVRPEAVDLSAGGAAGLFYGVMSLRQLARQANPAGEIPCLQIEDRPELPVRGVLLDISRDRVPTMQTLKGLIDLWAELKLNQVQLYTEHTFAYPGHESVWREASPVTPEEAEELDRYCRQRAVELVPNQNSFGHMERWLRHPAYRDLADATGSFVDPWGALRTEPTTLNPLDPRSIELLSGLYDQLLSHFRSDTLNVGADEPIDLGHGRSAEACRRDGPGRVYLNFLLQIHRQVAKRGKIMQFFADVMVHYPELLRQIPRGVVALEWGYEADHPFGRECRALAEGGLSFYVCPGTSSWNSLGGRWSNARDNIRTAVREGLACGAGGFLLTDWGDNGHWQQLPVSYPAYLYGAALSWNPHPPQGLDLEACLSRHVFQDSSGGAARALLALGQVHRNEVARLANAAVLAVLLLPALETYHHEALKRLRGYDFSPERSLIREALERLGEAKIRAPDGPLLRGEIELTARLMDHAARLGRERFSTAELAVGQIPSRRRQAMAEELGELAGHYRALWLSRSRPGGLADSAGRLDRLRACYLAQ